ncbi:hypothetical protein [Modestobacter versicolor]|uniref:Uncharacterized protein n=1 Tax=Modestobacter versicolor TaxID=429133 RepID=A0A323V5G3_9ACTN|nr:hypothetical protein [Modestobacter versicolor]MBB3676325.1 hypothetical protein [Modestobacter versicolor]PZA20125.1 hypothetical protein DMO24_17080 [Modestobacter versicolor]
MTRSQRFIFRNMQGRTRHNINWDAITQESSVDMTAAMWQFSGGIFGTDGRPVLGEPGREPNVYITNIGPHGKPGREAGGVEFLAHTETDHPVDVMVTVTVSDPVEATTVLG